MFRCVRNRTGSDAEHGYVYVGIIKGRLDRWLKYAHHTTLIGMCIALTLLVSYRFNATTVIPLYSESVLETIQTITGYSAIVATVVFFLASIAHWGIKRSLLLIESISQKFTEAHDEIVQLRFILADPARTATHEVVVSEFNHAGLDKAQKKFWWWVRFTDNGGLIGFLITATAIACIMLITCFGGVTYLTGWHDPTQAWVGIRTGLNYMLSGGVIFCVVATAISFRVGNIALLFDMVDRYLIKANVEIEGLQLEIKNQQRLSDTRRQRLAH
jgi:hypothetical protein